MNPENQSEPRKKPLPPRPKKGEHRSPATEVKPGQVLNPRGAPRKGMSIAETVRTIQELTPGELRYVLKQAGSTGRSGLENALATLPQNVPMRFIAHLSAMVATVCEPQAPLMNYLADREEGKVKERRVLEGPDGQPLFPKNVVFFDDGDGA